MADRRAGKVPHVGRRPRERTKRGAWRAKRSDARGNVGAVGRARRASLTDSLAERRSEMKDVSAARTRG